MQQARDRPALKLRQRLAHFPTFSLRREMGDLLVSPPRYGSYRPISKG